MMSIWVDDLHVFHPPRAKMPLWPGLSGNAAFRLLGLLEAGLWEGWDGVFLFTGSPCEKIYISHVTPMLIYLLCSSEQCI